MHGAILTSALLLIFLLPAVLLSPVVYSAFPYRDYVPLLTAFMDLAQAHPQQMTYQVVGTTVLGADMMMFKIGNPEGGRVLFDGAIHGTEAIDSELLYSYAKWLLESNDTLAKETLRTTYTLLIPVVNVDKENYARKNADGVDLNRNFATSWSSSGSNLSTSDQYRGPSPLSEPESRALVDVFKTFKPSFYVNLHMWDDPYYAGCRYANATYQSMIVSRIANLSRERGVSPFRYYGQFGGAGMAIGDAARLGITSFLIELSKDVIPLSEVQTNLLARFIPVASILSSEARPPALYDHDISVYSLTPTKTLVGKGSTLVINVDVANLGRNAESFNLTVKVNSTVLSLMWITLQVSEVRSVTVNWNTSIASYGSYVLSVYAAPVLNETDTSDNSIDSVRIAVTLPGDLNGDFTVDIFDALLLAGSLNSEQDSPNWNPNSDLNGDNEVGIYDASILASHFGQGYLRQN